MDLESLGRIGEFIGGIAVVVSLVCLAVQIRQGSASLKATKNLVITLDVQLILYPIDNPTEDHRVFGLWLLLRL